MLPKGLLKEYSRLLTIIMLLLDMFMVATAAHLAYFYRFHQISYNQHYLTAILLGVFLTPVIFSFLHLYSSVRGRNFFGYIFDLCQAIVICALLLAGLAFFTKSGAIYSRYWFSLWMLFSLLLIVLFRFSLLQFLRFMRSHGLNERRVVIFGATALGIKFADTVQQALWTGFRIVAFLDDQAAQKSRHINHIPVIQTPQDLCGYLKDNGIDEIWLALPLCEEKRVKEILHILRHQPMTMRFVLDIFSLDLLNHSITNVAGFPVLNIRSSPMVGINRFIKAIEDRLLAACILFIISPLIMLIALAVKTTSKGPIFFKQRRLGWDGRIIKIYKFRTMFLHREQGGEVTQATFSDPRITPLGKFLRRTSLDELPQFINVLQGRMSIVGPRPHALAHNELYKDSVPVYMQRHRVKPGITGWAQVNGWRGETDTIMKMRKRVEYDLYYINNWSLRFDLKIIFLTLFRGFIGRNAY